jgi:SAM-dependent methyltransferase
MSGAHTFRVAAEAYEQHVGRYGPELAEALIDFAGVEPGMRALDVGCGPGALVSRLAARLGAERVCGVEPSSPFADACRARAPGVSVTVAVAEELPFAARSFDATLSQLVVNFMSDPQTGVREMARVTREGGLVAACVWDYAGEMTLLRAFWDAARDIDGDGDGAAEADEGAVMPWCGDGELAGLWQLAGFDDIRAGALIARARYESFDELWAPFPLGVGPSGAYCASLDLQRRQALRDAFRMRLDVGDSPFELTARAWAVTGIVPSGTGL